MDGVLAADLSFFSKPLKSQQNCYSYKTLDFGKKTWKSSEVGLVDIMTTTGRKAENGPNFSPDYV